MCDDCVLANNPDGYFQLNAVTGQIVLQKPVDFETVASNPLLPVIHAIDGGSSARTGSLTLTLSVTDVSDEKPSCTDYAHDVTVPESALIGTTVSKFYHNRTYF